MVWSLGGRGLRGWWKSSEDGITKKEKRELKKTIEKLEKKIKKLEKRDQELTELVEEYHSFDAGLRRVLVRTGVIGRKDLTFEHLKDEFRLPKDTIDLRRIDLVNPKE